MTMKEQAKQRAREAWDQRFKHAKAASAWAAIAHEKPESAAVSEVLANWMSAYADADAAAEKAFCALAASEETSHARD
jgi:hypothetical protein